MRPWKRWPPNWRRKTLPAPHLAHHPQKAADAPAVEPSASAAVAAGRVSDMQEEGGLAAGWEGRAVADAHGGLVVTAGSGVAGEFLRRVQGCHPKVEAQAPRPCGPSVDPAARLPLE